MSARKIEAQVRQIVVQERYDALLLVSVGMIAFFVAMIVRAIIVMLG